MSSERHLASWATPSRRRPRLVRGLIRDLNRISAGTRWSGPAGVPAPIDTRRTAAPTGSLRARLAPGLRGVHVEGPNPAPLPAGPVILVANHPTAAAAVLVLSRLDPARRARTLVLAGPHESIDLRTRLTRPVLRLDPEAPGRQLDRLRARLGEGWSVLIFPEGAPAAGATHRDFHPFAADLAEGTGLPVIPVGVRGARAVGATPGASRVSVRFGDPLHPGADARDQEAAVTGLIAEDRATWWAVQQSQPGELPGSKTPESAHSWRRVWAQTAPPAKGGVTETPRIWR